MKGLLKWFVIGGLFLPAGLAAQDLYKKRALLHTELNELPDKRRYRDDRIELLVDVAALENELYYFDEVRTHLDEALLLLEKERDDFLEGRAYLLRGNASLYLGDYEQAGRDYAFAYAKFVDEKEEEQIAKTLWRLGELYRYQRSGEDAFPFYDRAQVLFIELEDPAGEAEVVFSRAKMRHMTRDFAGALNDYLMAAGLFQEKGDYANQGLAHLSTGIVLRSQKALEDAHFQISHAVEIFSQNGISRNQADALLALGDLERSLYQDSKAEKNLKKARDLYKSLGLYEGEGDALRSLGNLARADGDYDMALHYYQQALEAYRYEASPETIAPVLQNLGDMERWYGRGDIAREYYAEALTIYENTADTLGKANILLGLGLVESGPDPDLALTYFEDSAVLYEQAGMTQASNMAREAARRLEADVAR